MGRLSSLQRLVRLFLMLPFFAFIGCSNWCWGFTLPTHCAGYDLTLALLLLWPIARDCWAFVWSEIVVVYACGFLASSPGPPLNLAPMLVFP